MLVPATILLKVNKKPTVLTSNLNNEDHPFSEHILGTEVNKSTCNTHRYSDPLISFDLSPTWPTLALFNQWLGTQSRNELQPAGEDTCKCPLTLALFTITGISHSRNYLAERTRLARLRGQVYTRIKI